MGRGQSNRGIDTDFPFSFIHTADHGIEHNKYGNDQRNRNVRHAAVAHGITGVIEKGAVCFSAKQRKTETVHQILSNILGSDAFIRPNRNTF